MHIRKGITKKKKKKHAPQTAVAMSSTTAIQDSMLSATSTLLIETLNGYAYTSDMSLAKRRIQIY